MIPAAPPFRMRKSLFAIRSRTGHHTRAPEIPASIPFARIAHPGTYELVVTGPGFVDQKTQPFELSSGQAGSMQITLQVAGQASTVTVQATEPILQTTSASLGSVVTSTQVTELPIARTQFPECHHARSGYSSSSAGGFDERIIARWASPSCRRFSASGRKITIS